MTKSRSQAAPVNRFTTNAGRRNTPLMPYFHWRAKAINELRKSDLQWTKFTNGFFLDYYGLPHVKSYLKPLTIAVDVQNMAAALPGTGNEPVTFSYSFDVANFVAAALDLAEWPEDSMIIGDKLTFNDLVKLAERARGSLHGIFFFGRHELIAYRRQIHGHVRRSPDDETIQSFRAAGSSRAIPILSEAFCATLAGGSWAVDGDGLVRFAV